MKFEAVPDDGNSPSAAEADPTWRDSLPESVREWKEVTDAKTADDFYTQMGEIRSHVGNSIRIPGEDASDEDRAAFNQRLVDKKIGVMPIPDPDNDESMNTLYQQMGRPGEAGQYKMPEIEGLDENDSRVAQFKGYAYKAGLTQKQFAEMLEPMVHATNTANTEVMEEHRAALETLRGEWGLKYDQNTSGVRKLLEASQAPESVLNAMDNGNMSAPELVWLNGLATQMGAEGNPIGSQGDAGSGMLSPAEAELRISEIMNNKAHPYWNGADPAHKAAKTKMRELYLMKAGRDNKVIPMAAAG